MSLLFFFIDGIGIASAKKNNQLISLFADFLSPHTLSDLTINTELYFSSGGACAVDAILDIQGLPQSATGQTSLVTGVNAQKLLGYHLSAFPNIQLIELIKEKSLMKKLSAMGFNVTCANLYSEEFFKERSASRKNRFPVSTLMVKAANSSFRMAGDYLNREAVFADITNALLIERGWDITLISPESAAENMINILDKFDFVFFEYFMTDFYGHRRDKSGLDSSIRVLNSFLAYIFEHSGHDVLIVSDHGNAEDFSHASHTLNPVPVLLFSTKSEKVNAFLHGLNRLDQIYQRIINYYQTIKKPVSGREKT